MRKVLFLLIILHYVTFTSIGQRSRNRFTTKITKKMISRDARPFYPDPWFSIIEPNQAKHRTAAYGDYRYFDQNYEYTINMDFYRYGATEAPDFDVNPANIAEFDDTNSKHKSYWQHYKYYYRYAFLNGTEQHAYEEFRKNLRKMKNLSEDIPTANFRINEFTHYSTEEFIDLFTGFDGTTVPGDDESAESYEREISKYPADLDWSVYDGIETKPPLHQGKCNISYVYSAIHNIEMKLLIDSETNVMEYLSMQQGFDCSSPKRECSQPGKPHYVLRGLQQAGGGVHLSTVVYGENDPNLTYTCQWHADERDKENSTVEVIATIIDWGLLTVENEEELILALNEYGPLCTAIYVTDALKNYHSGVLTEQYCEDHAPNHAVLLTGYGWTKDDIPYWILKNSWGSQWGEKGFFFLIRYKAACGIGRYLAYSFVKSATTTTTTTTEATKPPTTTQCDPRIDQCEEITFPTPPPLESTTLPLESTTQSSASVP